ncbi:MAG: hypothetical protein IPK78_00735 [Rhodospirillales bacterium]|nr:hypothetical protein [Rhodospirillales bacterium]
MKKPATITIEGRRYLWRDILALRKAQIEEARAARQLALFALKEDCRPRPEKTAAGRYAEPSLFTLLTNNNQKEETP